MVGQRIAELEIEVGRLRGILNVIVDSMSDDEFHRMLNSKWSGADRAFLMGVRAEDLDQDGADRTPDDLPKTTAPSPEEGGEEPETVEED